MALMSHEHLIQLSSCPHFDRAFTERIHQQLGVLGKPDQPRGTHSLVTTTRSATLAYTRAYPTTLSKYYTFTSNVKICDMAVTTHSSVRLGSNAFDWVDDEVEFVADAKASWI